MNKLIIFLYILLLFGCKENSTSNQISKINNDKQKYSKTTRIDFNQFKVLDSDESRNLFKSKKYRFTYSNTSETFNLFTDNKKIGVIDYAPLKYDGPGFKIYQYSSSQQSPYIVFVIEATADIGTEWYKVIIIKNEKIISDFLINEPRSDSERYLLKEFMSISFQKDTFTFKLKKKLIVSYSYIPQDYQQDKNYIYIDKNISLIQLSPTISIDSTPCQKPIIEYFPNGKLKLSGCQGSYNGTGIQVGLWKKYNEKGELIETTYYHPDEFGKDYKIITQYERNKIISKKIYNFDDLYEVELKELSTIPK
ncbi:hypothetical protein [uncultured Gilliamella sp.]|uniref:hypothetical protein n=1 Tax=uncultured Gilliamella sp. TaxID=1193505 RepID=UPI0025FCD054|nr:hypothetical protein [uncultured Gilliamella sp.]